MVAKGAGEKEIVIFDPKSDNETVHHLPHSMIVPKGLEDQSWELIKQTRQIISHDVNNMLTCIFGNLSMAEVEQDPEKVRTWISHAFKSVNAMRDYFDAQESNRIEELNIANILEDVIACRMVAWKMANTNIVEKNIDPLLKISCNKLDLVQVISNLLNNAFEACNKTEGRAPRIVVSLEQSGPVNKCIIRDNGIGIPNNEEQFGQSGYTTKTEGNGHGLGLSISRGLLKNMGVRSFDLRNNCDREDLKDEPGEKHGASAIIEFPPIV